MSERQSSWSGWGVFKLALAAWTLIVIVFLGLIAIGALALYLSRPPQKTVEIVRIVTAHSASAQPAPPAPPAP